MTTTMARESARETHEAAYERWRRSQRAVEEALEANTPTPSAPERASAEALRGVPHGFGGPY